MINVIPCCHLSWAGPDPKPIPDQAELQRGSERKAPKPPHLRWLSGTCVFAQGPIHHMAEGAQGLGLFRV